ncbi:MAG: hypothetical protein LBG80_02090, partial [Bacteroidales bacterium]|nr:hypothetical protein [Bacteroidales bacterium]
MYKMYILSEMSTYSLGKEYNYQGQTWVNDTLTCGCLVAKCISILPSDEDIKLAEEYFNKKNILLSWIKNKIGDISKHIAEVEQVDSKLKNFITLKQKKYNFGRNVDFNGEYYYIKLKQGQNCKDIMLTHVTQKRHYPPYYRQKVIPSRVSVMPGKFVILPQNDCIR